MAALQPPAPTPAREISNHERVSWQVRPGGAAAAGGQEGGGERPVARANLHGLHVQRGAHDNPGGARPGGHRVRLPRPRLRPAQDNRRGRSAPSGVSRTHGGEPAGKCGTDGGGHLPARPRRARRGHRRRRDRRELDKTPGSQVGLSRRADHASHRGGGQKHPVGTFIFVNSCMGN